MRAEQNIVLIKEDFEGMYYAPDDCPITRAIKRTLILNSVYCTTDAAYTDQMKYKVIAKFKEPYSKRLHAMDELMAAGCPANTPIRTFTIYTT